MKLLLARLNWLFALKDNSPERYVLARFEYMAAIREAERFVNACARARVCS
jgi:hypothetical protein